MKTMHIRLFFLIATLITGILSGCATQEQNLRSQDRYNNLYEPLNKKTLPAMTSDELEKSGDAFLNTGNLPKALVQYEKSLQLKPDNIEVVYKKGMLFVIGGLNQDAIKEFQKVLKEESGHALAYKGMGQAFFQMKKYDEAKKNFQKAIELDPGLWKVYNSLGIIYDYKEKYHMAIHKYNKAISLKPDEGFLYNNLGVSWSLAGDYKKAINAFNKALETKYSKSKTYNNLGMALSKLGRYREALEAFRKGGNEAQAYNNLGCIYLEEGKFEKAITCFEKAIEINPGFYARASENLIKARTVDEIASPKKRLLVEKFKIWREPKNDSIAFKLKLRNLDGRRIEGYTFVVLKHDKKSQEPFRRVCPEASLKDGRPISFKKGEFFSIIRFKFVCGAFSNIKTVEDFKTATVYVYSKTGRLLFEKAYKVK